MVKDLYIFDVLVNMKLSFPEIRKQHYCKIRFSHTRRALFFRKENKRIHLETINKLIRCNFSLEFRFQFYVIVSCLNFKKYIYY